MTSATMIGTAFLRAIDDESAGGTKDRVSAARDDRVLPEAPVRPCILNTISDDIVHPILLSGPEGSGKSSILLDLACTLAAQTPCRCNDTPCRCNAVLFLSPLAMKESFPLFCHPWSDQENSQDSRLDKNLLNRIRIHHVATLHEIYTILLSLQGLHVTHQPWGGILIDNLDFWVKDQSVLTTQLVALLVDSSSYLMQQSRLPRPVAVAASMVHPLSSKLTNFCTPVSVILKPSPIEAFENAVSFWSADCESSQKRVQYAVTVESDGMNRIIWRK